MHLAPGVIGFVRKAMLIASSAALVGGLGACGGGSTGGGVAPTPVPPQPPLSPTPDPAGAEFQANYGLAAINAQVPFARGASGEGVTVAIIDDGIDFAQPDLAGNISPNAIDVIPGRNQPGGGARHGTQVAGPLASAHNGFGTVGVAYEATILAVRADRPSACAGGETTRCFTPEDITAGLNAALDRGARVINLSFGYNSGNNLFGPDFEAALARAVAANAVILISAGNSGGAETIFPARYAADPRFAGHVIAVGATNQSGNIAGFSNRAGTAANSYILAPGQNIPVDCSTAGCTIASGTSFSAPHVAGAVALLLHAFPNLNAFSAADILLRSARDLGDPGTDPIYGRGMLDLDRAFQPMGALAARAPSGMPVAAAAPPWQRLGAPFGDAVWRSGAMRTLARDDYQRPYIVDLARAFPGAGPGSVRYGGGAAMGRAERVLGEAGQGIAILSLEGPRLPARAEPPLAPAPAPDFAQPRPHRFALALGAGPLTATFWRSAGAGPLPLPDLTGDDFLSYVSADRGARLDLALGRLRISFDHGAGRRSAAPFGPPAAYPLSVSRVQLAGSAGRLDWRLRVGSLDETTGPLGSFLRPDGAFAMPARTDYASLGFNWRAGTGLWLDADAGLGRSRVPSGLLHLAAPAFSSYWRLSATADCARLGWPCAFLRAELAQPMRIESGRFETMLEDVPDAYFAAPAYSIRSFSAAPSGRQIDLRISAGGALGNGASLLLEAYGIRHPGHSRFAPAAYGLVGRWLMVF